MKDRRTILIEKTFRMASIGAVILSVSLAILWVFFRDLPLEPVLVILGLVYAEVPLLGRWIIGKMGDELEREQLTMPYALAHGYVNNYLAPVVKQLRKEAGPRADDLRFYVYIPRTLDELKEESISEILSELETRQYEIETVEIESAGAKRRRDCRTARKAPSDGNTGSIKYFDFPTTLLTLEQAVEFKLDTREDSFPYRQREALGREYIENFRKQLEGMLDSQRHEAIRKNVRIVDGGFDFLERSAATELHQSTKSTETT